MKKIVLFLFIVGIVFPAEAAHAITFVPDFVDHYKHHNSEHHKLSFIDFVLEHASGGHEETGKHSQDKCPIDHNHHLSTQSVYFFEDVKLNFVEVSRLPFSETSTPLPEYVFCNSEYIANIWQPPKIG